VDYICQQILDNSLDFVQFANFTLQYKKPLAMRMITRLLENKHDISIIKSNGKNVLQMATTTYPINLGVIKSLLKIGVDVNIRDHEDNTPLHYVYKNFEATKILIENNADINAINNLGETTLHKALKVPLTLEIAGVITLLIQKGININIQDKYQQTPLSLAIKNANDSVNSHSIDSISFLVFPIIHLLIDHGANVNDYDKQDGKTVLHIGVSYNDTLLIDKCISKGINLNAKDNDGNTALRYGYYRLESVDILIKSGTDINATNSKGKSILHIAIQEKANVEIVRFLLKSGVNVNARDSENRTALEYTTENTTYTTILKEYGAECTSKD